MRICSEKNPLVKDPSSLKMNSGLTAGEVNALILLDEIFHYILNRYFQNDNPGSRENALEHVVQQIGNKKEEVLFHSFNNDFRKIAAADSVHYPDMDDLILLWLTNQNPAVHIRTDLFDDSVLVKNSDYSRAIAEIYRFFSSTKGFGPNTINILDFLLLPMKNSPDSLEAQLLFIQQHWAAYIGNLLTKLLRALDFLKEERKAHFPPGPGPSSILTYDGDFDGGGFSDDTDWMPNVVMIAKSTFVWMDQLSRKYKRSIRYLNEIPDEELNTLSGWGINTLWLIGLWERSNASKRIKNLCGNPEAESSAYSLKAYEIAEEIGGWGALKNLKDRCTSRGIRLASDMVPNHTGLDSDWIMSAPDRFIQLPHPPFPGYTFNGPNLSNNPEVGIFLEDHYYDKTDAAVVFKYIHFPTNRTRYIYHGNDGTSMPWNDTAQLDYLQKEVREAVIETILHVARNFPVIRFDAAMTLAKKHVQRLWFPAPGSGGDIPSRSSHGLTADEFNRAMPKEFWREVVDRVAEEVPDTLLLAEAFWMMEGFFVKNLGMHRVYNSAFMNMLKQEENQKYRESIKNTLLFDSQILKRFVNFMNNPDEDTAVQQFGKGDKYFGICTMMVAMPGLPMFGHGQIEGFREKYGMEYRKAYLDETPDEAFIERHRRDIFPLLKKRYLFSEVENFSLYDLNSPDGSINENVFIWSNKHREEYMLAAYNNSPYEASGFIRKSVPKKEAGDEGVITVKNLASALDLPRGGQYYLYFTEMHTQLTYIRKVSALHSDGLFIKLYPYETHLYLTMNTVLDEDGSWKAVEESLNGQGVGNIIRYKRQLLFKPLHTLISIFFTNERIDTLSELVTKSHPLKKRFCNNMKADFEVLCHELSNLVSMDTNRQNRIIKIFTENFTKISQLLKGNKTYWKKYIARGMSIMPEAPSLLMTWLVFSPLKVLFPSNDSSRQPLFLSEVVEYTEDMGGLDLCKGAIQNNSFSPSDFDEIAQLFKIVISFVPPVNSNPRVLLNEFINFPLIKDYLKINSWEGRIFFKREAFQTVTWWVYFLSCMREGKMTKQINRNLKAWIESEEKSNCEITKLLEQCKI